MGKDHRRSLGLNLRWVGNARVRITAWSHSPCCFPRPDCLLASQPLWPVAMRYSAKCAEQEFSEVQIQHLAYSWPQGTQGWTRDAYVVHTRHVARCYVHDLAQG